MSYEILYRTPNQCVNYSFFLTKSFIFSALLLGCFIALESNALYAIIYFSSHKENYTWTPDISPDISMDNEPTL